MIPILHWFASFVILSVALAHLESIRIADTGVGMLVARGGGWMLVGLSAFDGIITPFFGDGYVPHKIGMIGLASVAMAYRWEGATRRNTGERRAKDVH